MKGSSGLGYGNQHSKGKAPGKMMGAIAGIAGKLMGKKDEEASGAKYATPAKTGGVTKSERATADGASEATVKKLQNIEAGEKKKSELTDPVKIKRVEKKLDQLQPNKTT